MLGKAMFTSMVDYHGKANERLLELAATLPDDVLDQPLTEGGRSMRLTFRHISAADGRWRSFLETHERKWVDGVDDQYATIVELANIQAAETGALAIWLDSQTEAELLDPVEIIWDGESYMMAPWHGLLQLLLHGQQHRSEIAMAMTRLGKSPNDLDYIMYV